MAKDSIAASPSESDWRARGDHDTLERACEIMADRIRMRNVIREHSRQARADRHLDKLLKAGRLRRYKGY